MATSKPALAGKTDPGRPQIISNTERAAVDRALQQCIAERAYELYDASGQQDGYDQQHWFQAESEVLQRGRLDARESGSWVSVVGTLPDASDEDLQVFLEPNRVVVRARTNAAEQSSGSQQQASGAAEFFLVEDLSVEVEPASATASFKDKTLTLMVRKSSPRSATPGPATRQGK